MRGAKKEEDEVVDRAWEGFRKKFMSYRERQLPMNIEEDRLSIAATIVPPVHHDTL